MRAYNVHMADGRTMTVYATSRLAAYQQFSIQDQPHIVRIEAVRRAGAQP